MIDLNCQTDQLNLAYTVNYAAIVDTKSEHRLSGRSLKQSFVCLCQYLIASSVSHWCSFDRFMVVCLSVYILAPLSVARATVFIFHDVKSN